VDECAPLLIGLMYDVQTQQVFNFVGGMADIRAKAWGVLRPTTAPTLSGENSNLGR